MDDKLYTALIRADRSAALGAAAADVAAEINDLLTQIMTAEGLPPAAEQACLAVRELTRRLAALGRNDGPPAGHTSLAPAEVLRAAVSAAAAEQVAEVTVAADPAVAAVLGNRDELVQVFRALVRNAAEAMTPAPPRPRIQLQARDCDLADGQIEGLPGGAYVEFEVRDNGQGIAPEHLQRIWEPLYTTRPHAAGVGLPMVLAVVRRHGGQVGVDSAVGEGSVFTIYLPVAPAAAPASGAVSAPPTRFRTGRILVMDDNERIRSGTAAALQRLDYTCDAVRDADEAVGWYRRYLDIGRPYDAVLLDLNAPGGVGGAAALAQIRALDPDSRAIALSPLPAERLAPAAEAAGFTGWLTKPFRASELGEVLQVVLRA